VKYVVAPAGARTEKVLLMLDEEYLDLLIWHAKLQAVTTGQDYQIFKLVETHYLKAPVAAAATLKEAT
jgi:hypothetical protein